MKNGRPRQKQKSNTFEPSALLMAMSNLPSRATMTEPMQSGKEDPTASTVNPVMPGPYPKHNDTSSAMSTEKQNTHNICLYVPNEISEAVQKVWRARTDHKCEDAEPRNG